MNKAVSAMPEPLKFFLTCLYAAFIGTVIISVAALLSAFFLTYTDNPESFYNVCIVCAKIICGILAGRIAIRKNKRYAIVCGTVTALFIMGILFIISLFVPQYEAVSSWWQTLLIPLCTIVGAVISNTAA